MNRTWVIGTVVVLGLALAGASASYLLNVDDPSDADVTSPGEDDQSLSGGGDQMSSGGPIQSDSEYGSVAEAVEAINAAGIECTGRKVLSRGEPKETGLCYVNDGEYEIDLYIFETTTSRDLWLQGLRDVYDQEIVVGGNWYLTTGLRSLSDRIAEALDGEVTT